MKYPLCVRCMEPVPRKKMITNAICDDCKVIKVTLKKKGMILNTIVAKNLQKYDILVINNIPVGINRKIEIGGYINIYDSNDRILRFDENEEIKILVE